MVKSYWLKKKYFSVDILTKYLLFQSRNYNSNLVVPFVALGMGNTKIEKQEFYTINCGVGSYFWFSDDENCNCHLLKTIRVILGYYLIFLVNLV